MTQHEKWSLQDGRTHTSRGCLPQTGSWNINNFNGPPPLQLCTRLQAHTPLSPPTPVSATLPRCSGDSDLWERQVKTGNWLYDRGRSTHCWGGLRSQGKWSWPCCCKFLAISQILSLDLLLATGFSYHESEYHILKKSKILYHFRKMRFYSISFQREEINFLALSICISYRTHRKEIPCEPPCPPTTKRLLL